MLLSRRIKPHTVLIAAVICIFFYLKTSSFGTVRNTDKSFDEESFRYGDYMPDSSEYYEDENNTLALRLQKMLDLCSQLNTSLDKDFPLTEGHLYEDASREIIMCLLPRVASATILQMLANSSAMANSANQKTISDLSLMTPDKLAKFSIRKIKTDSTTFKGNYDEHFKFLFVRNPYSRMESVYRTLFSSAQPGYVSHIVRHIKSKLHMTNSAVAFRDFLSYVVDDVASSRSSSPFWKPIYQACLPCSIDYDMVGTVETLKEEFDKWMETFSDIVYDVPLPQANRAAVSSPPISRSMWRTVNATVMDRFLQLYKYDFEIFGYNKSLPQH